jgi:hypothetical protein
VEGFVRRGILKASQDNIAKYLKAKPEYVVNTSEFNDVKDRLAMLHNRRRTDKKDDPSRPTLRRNTAPCTQGHLSRAEVHERRFTFPSFCVPNID